MTDRPFVDRMRAKLFTKNVAWRFESNASRAPARNSDNAKLVDMKLAQSLLSKGERGAVITDIPASWLPGDDRFALGGEPEFDEEAFRSALIFYDRFDFPENSVATYSSPTLENLKQFDFFQRSQPSYDGGMAAAIGRHAFDVFLALEKREPNRWSICRSAQQLGIPAGELSAEQGFALTLQNALPVFDRVVPLTEVLEFKAKRFDELDALRTSLNELVLEVTKNGTNDFAQTIVFERFDRSLADHMKVMSESNLQRVTTSFRQSISWDALGTPAVEAALTQTISAAGVIGAVATIGIKTWKGLKRIKSLSPFEYLTSVNRDLY